MSFQPREYVRHILSEPTYLLTASQGLEKSAFLA